MAANAADLDLRNNEKSNGSGDSSDDDAKSSTNQRYNDEEELEPYRLEKLLLDDSYNEPTEHHTGADGSLAQIINMKQEARKSVWMAKEKAHLPGRLWCAALLEIALSTPLDCEAILMMHLQMIWPICYLEIPISGAVSTTQQRAEAVHHWVKNEHSVNVWGISSRLGSDAPNPTMQARIAKENRYI